MTRSPITKEQANWLIDTIIEGWKSEGVISGPKPAVVEDPLYVYADVYHAAVSLIHYTSNLACSLDIIKAVFDEAVRDQENVDWIATEIWFEVRGAGPRSRDETALDDLRQDRSLSDRTLDNYNRRKQRLINL